MLRQCKAAFVLSSPLFWENREWTRLELNGLKLIKFIWEKLPVFNEEVPSPLPVGDHLPSDIWGVLRLCDWRCFWP